MSLTNNALFRRFPQAAPHIPWLSLGHFPTPVQLLPPAARAYFGTDLWVKRDDVSGDPYGGNKIRKLEFLLAHARHRGAKRVVTVGALGSHHALATTIYARRLGLDVTLVLFPQHVTPHVRDMVLMDHALGAELRFTRRMETVPAALWSARLAHRRERVLVIPPGGSDAIGTLGYVGAALELAEQVQNGECPVPGQVHVAGGTLGTAAGLALGFALAGLPARVLAFRITSRIVTNMRVMAGLVRGAARILRRAGVGVPDVADVLSRVELGHEHMGRGYGQPTESGDEATRRFAGLGLTLDPTYTAKAAAGLTDSVRQSPEGTHLFWHTLSAREPRELLAHADLATLPVPFRELIRG